MADLLDNKTTSPYLPILQDSHTSKPTSAHAPFTNGNAPASPRVTRNPSPTTKTYSTTNTNPTLSLIQAPETTLKSYHESMGHWHSKQAIPAIRDTKKESRKPSWRDTTQSILASFGYTPTSTNDDIPTGNIFGPVQKDNILSQIPIGRHHPVPRTGVEDDDKRTLHTNKFYANTFLGAQNKPVWTHPYSIWWGKGWQDVDIMQTWGMNVAHVEEQDYMYGESDPPNSFIAPRKQSLIISAKELDAQTLLTTDTHLPFSVNINLISRTASPETKISFPVVQGMTFVTAVYLDGTPAIHTAGKGFADISPPTKLGETTTKYQIKDMDGRIWLIYVRPAPGIQYDPSKFTRIDPNTLLGPSGFRGTIQVAKNPLGEDGEAIYDKASGTFVCEAKLTATVTDNKGVYSFSYTKVGGAPLLMFALPHHVQSLDTDMKDSVTKLQLRTTTKGMATAVWAEKMTMIEPNLPTTLHFGPWHPTMTGSTRIRYPPEIITLLATVAELDLRRAMTDVVPQDSMYYAGKFLAKFATILWVLKDVLNNESLVSAGLDKLKQEMAIYVENKQKYPLYYDDSWKGIVSNAGFTDPGADFGNTYYNDHHFHFGYFVYTAAVIGYLDPGWMTTGDNKAWVNMLVKDFAESDYNGRDYPFSRSFDWWHGHSWAKGLFESADGKDQESTSEDGFASYALKMWGKISGDGDMEKRGTLMLAIQARSFANYFYLQTNNANQPSRFLPNKVTGILFEGKVDYATYFGLATPLIHGIHMVPISPASTLLRPRSFATEEWNTFFSDNRALELTDDETPSSGATPNPVANSAAGGWRGILMANAAAVDPALSLEFFQKGVEGEWEEKWIDGGASRCWYLVWAAGMVEVLGPGRK